MKLGKYLEITRGRIDEVRRDPALQNPKLTVRRLLDVDLPYWLEKAMDLDVDLILLRSAVDSVRPYLSHLAECASIQDAPCTCGLKRALANLEPLENEPPRKRRTKTETP